MNYEFEKKQAEEKLAQEKKDVISDAELKQQKQQRNYFIAGFILMLALAFFIFRGYRQKQKANLALADKNFTIEEQKKMVEVKQKEILDSIHYAKRIQKAIITSEYYINKNLQRLNDKTKT